MTPEEHQATASTPATSKRINLSASYIPNQNPIGSLISKVNPYLGPKKERKILVGTPLLTHTPSQAPLPTIPVTLQTDILLQSPEPPQIPGGRVGYNPELRSILSKHEESLQRLIDRYSRHKLHLSHQLNVDLAELEHQQTKSKCKLALIQKELTETVESNEKLNNKLLRFNFKLIDMNTYDRVFYIELDLAESDYRIVLMDPPCTHEGKSIGILIAMLVWSAHHVIGPPAPAPQYLDRPDPIDDAFEHLEKFCQPRPQAFSVWLYIHYKCWVSKHLQISCGNVSKYAPAGADVLDLGPGAFRNAMPKGASGPGALAKKVMGS
ncbi:uncharacterized protein PGTG_15659 [Puccinia graminis f. sp. tritici CRL 75-36-700-3]|uniref:Kinetochore protein SPC25 n=1 Tax=Puccinia graminis f. sp. tritici (strain CRL 75-36-700-3 / race SCCL) TaxID=418459 RepID=E3KYY5_PUCGT|nr:uncharacterized protein PGTG_15659 [Puccinia graminis f. sp. tritici CRL 75-36-700-3]EFP89510.1 hypothetical protein PGTG_15659 [Puccinia graminis f. sp. tritici CRL 75-36-700-3]